MSSTSKDTGVTTRAQRDDKNKELAPAQNHVRGKLTLMSYFLADRIEHTGTKRTRETSLVSPVWRYLSSLHRSIAP